MSVTPYQYIQNEGCILHDTFASLKTSSRALVAAVVNALGQFNLR